MKAKIIFFPFLVIVTILFMNCSRRANDNDFVPKNIVPVLIAKGELNVSDRDSITGQEWVIKSQEDWIVLKELMKIDFDEVDFSNYQVIAAFDNVRKNYGNSISIECVTEYAHSIVADVFGLLSAEEEKASSKAQPFHIVKIPVTSKGIVFERKYEEGPDIDDFCDDINEEKLASYANEFISGLSDLNTNQKADTLVSHLKSFSCINRVVVNCNPEVCVFSVSLNEDGAKNDVIFLLSLPDENEPSNEK